MSKPSRSAGFTLVHLLLLVTAGELALNRLASKDLPDPTADAAIPLWHLIVDRAGLFFLYFASTLAIAIVARYLWRVARRQIDAWAWTRWVTLGAGAMFVGLAGLNIAIRPDEQVSFWFECAFVALVLSIVVELLVRRAPLASKLGVLTLALPLLIPFYGPLALRLFDAGEAMWGGLPEQIRLVGQWALVAAALLSPYCFAPRPFVHSAARFGPMIVAASVGILSAIVLRRHYEVAMRLAHHGLGVDLGPGAPTQFLALYLLALSTIAWTVSACVSSSAEARADIGVGLSLLVMGGYEFAWPLQYLLGVVGLMTIAQASYRVQAQERHLMPIERYLAPPLSEEVWRRYMYKLGAALTAHEGERDWSVFLLEPVNQTVQGRPVRRIDLVTPRRGVGLQVSIAVYEGSLLRLEIFCGRNLNAVADPDWTLYALPEKLLGVGAHEEPPRCQGPVVDFAGDRVFAKRFRVRDRGGYSDRLLDEGVRARTAALVDGWVAFWDHRGLHYCVYPGQGAPIDHPIPLSMLAFRDSDSPETSVERLVTLIDLLVDITRNGFQLGDGDGGGGDVVIAVDDTGAMIERDGGAASALAHEP